MKLNFWHARLIRPGEVYGLSAINKYGSPLIQFYDLDCTCDQWPHGQPVSQYFVKTFMQIREGLDLQGGVAKWKMSRDEVLEFQDWIVRELGHAAWDEINFGEKK